MNYPVEIWECVLRALIEMHDHSDWEGLHCVARFARVCRLFANLVRRPYIASLAKSRLSVIQTVTTEAGHDRYHILANDQRHGLWTSYRGTMMIERSHYEDNQPHGSWERWYYQSGNEAVRGWYEHGKKEGHLLFWHERHGHALHKLLNYVHDRLEGEQKHWIPTNGRLVLHTFKASQGKLIERCQVPGCNNYCYHSYARICCL